MVSTSRGFFMGIVDAKIKNYFATQINILMLVVLRVKKFPLFLQGDNFFCSAWIRT